MSRKKTVVERRNELRSLRPEKRRNKIVELMGTKLIEQDDNVRVRVRRLIKKIGEELRARQ